jgi:hypothetical protein
MLPVGPVAPLGRTKTSVKLNSRVYGGTGMTDTRKQEVAKLKKDIKNEILTTLSHYAITKQVAEVLSRRIIHKVILADQVDALHKEDGFAGLPYSEQDFAGKQDTKECPECGGQGEITDPPCFTCSTCKGRLLY